MTFLKNYMYLFRNAYIRNYDLITKKNFKVKNNNKFLKLKKINLYNLF